MVLNNNKQIAHHTKEISAAVKNAKNVPAWVVAKVNRSASDLSDATHYMEGQSESYAEGGAIYKHKHMDATAKILEKTNKGYKVEFTDNSMKKPKTKIMYFLDINFDKDKGYFEKMETGGGVGITESDIIEGVSFKNKSGTIFVIDKIELDPKFGKLVISSLLGGKKGNYRDEITDFIAFLNKEKVVKYETGGGVEEKWQIKDSNDKYFSVSMQTGKPVWNESPDLGYSYEKQEAEKIKDKLVELGNKDLKVVEYNANWWKMKTGGGVQQPSYAIKLSELLNKYEPTLIGISRGMVKVTPSMAYSGAELSNMFKGFGDSMDIKNIVYRSLRDKESYPIVEKLTKGKYKLIKPTWTDNFEDYYFDNITKKEKGGEVESKLTGWKHKKK